MTKSGRRTSLHASLLSPPEATTTEPPPPPQPASTGFPTGGFPATPPARRTQPPRSAKKSAAKSAAKSAGKPAPFGGADLGPAPRLAPVSEEEYCAAPQYLKFQVTLERLNQALGVLDKAARSTPTPGAMPEAAACQVIGPAAKTILLCLHKLNRLRMDRASQSVVFDS
mmetsp:Transcript_49821/g.113154  ORF Transcript_49821/g.113154 Transcript_49821/m.113154 type:complete len:169 (-) Transcript_49821:317-823(-)